MMQKKRPLGITIIVIFEILFALILFIVGVGLVLANELVIDYMPEVPDFPAMQKLLPFVGLVIIMASLFNLVVSWGLWNGKKWTWTIFLAFAIIGTVGGLANLPIGIGNLIIDTFIIWYLLEPNVRSFYGVERKPRPDPVINEPSAASTSKIHIIYCTECGAENSVDYNFCRKCGNMLKKERDSEGKV